MTGRDQKEDTTYTVEWSLENDWVISSLVTVEDETVYVEDNSDSLYALNATTGTEKWCFDDVDTIHSSTVIDGTVYIKNDETLYALDAATGNREWTQHPVRSGYGNWNRTMVFRM